MNRAKITGMVSSTLTKTILQHSVQLPPMGTIYHLITSALHKYIIIMKLFSFTEFEQYKRLRLKYRQRTYVYYNCFGFDFRCVLEIRKNISPCWPGLP